jgi:hypothetical protein
MVRIKSFALLPLVVLPLLGYGTKGDVVDGTHQDSSVYDCGTIALYQFLQLEGAKVSLDEIEKHLPTPPPNGFSLMELRDVSRRFGMELIGVQLQVTDKAPRRSALLLLNEGRHGHYVVIRPVGHTGRLVQLLDFDKPPVVMDAARLYKAKAWTGIALIRSSHSWIEGLVYVVPLLSLVGGAVYIFLRRAQVLSLVRGQRGGGGTRSARSTVSI